MSLGFPALDAAAVYLSPGGRRCRWAPSMSSRERAVFLYDLRDGSPAPATYWSDGFGLRPENWHLLRKVADATARQ